MHLDLMRDKAKAMPMASDPDKIDSLRVWHCSYRTLKPLEAFSQLQTLVVASYLDESLSTIGSLSGLRYLRIVHLPKVTCLSPLAALKRLEVLSLETLPSWDASGKKTEVNSLDPIGELQRLRHLSLFAIVPTDKSLRPLERCGSLVSARFSKFPKQELQRFYGVTGISDEPVPDPDFETSS